MNCDCLTFFYLLAVPASTSWPEFEIVDFEDTFDSDSCDENNSKSLVMHIHGKPDAMTQSWMDQFEVLRPVFSLAFFGIISVGLLLILITLFIYCYICLG